MYYTLIDEWGNLTTVDRNEPPVTIGWNYIVNGLHYGGRTRDDAERAMLQYVSAKTPYRSLTQIAKHIGYHLVSLDRDRNMYLRSGNVPQGPFCGEDEGE